MLIEEQLKGQISCFDPRMGGGGLVVKKYQDEEILKFVPLEDC